jgi:hypothetical protein
MTRAKLFHGNIALTKQHLLEVLAHPDHFDWIPDGAHVIGLPQKNRALFEANMKLAHRLAAKHDGHPIILLPETVKEPELKPSVKAKLRRSMAAVRRGERGIPAERVAKELGLKW